MNRPMRAVTRKATAIVVIAAICGNHAVANPVTITQWTFQTDLNATTGSGTASLHGGTTGSSLSGTAGVDRGWSTATYASQGTGSGTRGVQFLFSTVGYEDLSFSFDHRASGTGSRWSQLDYTLNGTDWIAGFWNNGGGLSPHDGFYSFTVDLSEITGANNNAAFGVRIVSIFSPQAFNQNSTTAVAADAGYMRANADAKYQPEAGAGTSTYATSGTWRFRNVTLAGSLIPNAGGKEISWNTTTGDWNTTAANWTEGSGSTTFANGDTVSFANTAGGTITVAAGGVEPASATITASSGTYTFTGGAIGGTGSLTKSGGGTAVLAAANTFSGGTTINDGVLQVASDAALGNAAIGVMLGGGALQAGGTIAGSRGVTVNAGGGSIDTNGHSVAVGTIAGAGSFTKSGAGTLTATGFGAGGLNVSSGTMRITAAGATQLQAGTIEGVLELGGAQRFNLGSGTLGGEGTIRVLDSLAELNTTGSGIAAVLDGTIDLNPGNTENFVLFLHPTSGNTITVDGVISGNAAVQFSAGASGGAGITTLTAQNTYTGATFLNMGASGVLRMGTANALPAGTSVSLGVSHSGSGTQDRGTIDLAGFDLAIGGLASGSNASIRGIGNTSETLATLTVDQASDTTFHAQIGNGFATTTNMTGATAAIALVKTGTGTLTLTSTASNYTGGTTIHAGTLSVSADENLGGSSGGITLGGGTLEMTNSFTLSSGRTITAVADTTSTLAVTSGTVSYGGAFTGSGNLDKAGAGWLVVSDASSGYTGLFTISAGTLEVTGSNAFANGILRQTGGELLLAPVGGGEVTIPDLDGGGGTTTVAENATARVGGAGNSSYNGQIRGQGGLKKVGNGRLMLTGSNDFMGQALIEAGILELASGGSITAPARASSGGQLRVNGRAGGAVTIDDGGILSGSGTLGGLATIAGTHAPGNSPGLQIAEAGLSYNATAVLEWELSANTSSLGDRGVLFDAIDVTGGDLTIANGARIDLLFTSALQDLTPSTVLWSDAFWSEDRSWTIIDFASAGTSTGSFSLGTIGLDMDGVSLAMARPNASFAVNNVGGDLVLTYVAVPEPSTLLLAGLGLAAAGWVTRRRRHA